MKKALRCSLKIFRTVFTWWHGATVGTRLFTTLNGQQVGQDNHGNRYYRDARDHRRWVIFKSIAEASAVPPLWDMWLHHTLATPPLVEENNERLPHLPNLTGTQFAYRPQGSILGKAKRSQVKADYEAWNPNQGKF